jgi:8-oxo-dGTP pyrophosphatase MutT (NUDIX family)
VTDLSAETVRAAEDALGRPAVAAFEVVMSREEWRDLLAAIAPGRRHDAVFVLRAPDGRFAAMRKPGYPAGAWRFPGGGVEPGESLAEGATRELREETGLRAEPRRYLLRAHVGFAVDGVAHAWTTHVFVADVAAAGPFEAVDAGEAVAERRWVFADEVRAAGDLFRATGSAALRYRADLQDLILRLSAGAAS